MFGFGAGEIEIGGDVCRYLGSKEGLSRLVEKKSKEKKRKEKNENKRKEKLKSVSFSAIIEEASQGGSPDPYFGLMLALHRPDMGTQLS